MSYSRIIFEYPTGWVDPDFDPLAIQHLQCLETIRSAADRMGLGFSIRTSLRMADFAPRIAPEEALLISVHSVGIARNVVRLKESYLPGFYYFDRTGYSGWAEIAFSNKLQDMAVEYSHENNSDYLNDIRKQKISGNTSKYPQKPLNESVVVPSEPYIFFPLQTADDVVARIAYIDQLRLASLFAEKARDQSMKLLIKRHPRCSDGRVEECINNLVRNNSFVRLTDDSVNALIPAASGVVTINSGVGFESMLMGVPVITAGRSDYSFVTQQIKSEQDLEQLDISAIPGLSSVIDNFLGYYLRCYCLYYTDIDIAENLLNKWACEKYSSMGDIINGDCRILNDIQSYIVELEGMRRSRFLDSDAANRPSDVHCNGTFNRIIALLRQLAA